MVKRNKNKKVLSPSQSNTPNQPPSMPEGDDDLVDDLLAELDSRNQTVQHESAAVLLEMQDNQENTQAVGDKAQSAAKKQDSKSRYESRQVAIHSGLFFRVSQADILQARKALAQNHAPTDPEVDARLEREAKEEEASIKETCDKLGVQIHEVRHDVLSSVNPHQTPRPAIDTTGWTLSLLGHSRSASPPQHTSSRSSQLRHRPRSCSELHLHTPR